MLFLCQQCVALDDRGNNPEFNYATKNRSLKRIAMHTTLVYVQVIARHIADFVEATRRNHEASIRESGNARFDVLQSPDDPTQFVLYEAYLTLEAASEHKQTPHYLEWKETVAPWMAIPRKGVTYHGLYPASESSTHV
jgi:autoinducer 2-degrading protein